MNFESTRVNADQTLPNMIKVVNKTSKPYEAEENIPIPMLRCYGYGLIRAISPERRVFYVITPVEEHFLSKVNIFALGHCLQTPEMIFDTRSIEPKPYIVELGQTMHEDHKKLYSPLRNVTGMRRANLFGNRTFGEAQNKQKISKQGSFIKGLVSRVTKRFGRKSISKGITPRRRGKQSRKPRIAS